MTAQDTLKNVNLEDIKLNTLMVVFGDDKNTEYMYMNKDPLIVVGDYVLVEDKRHNHMDLGIAKVVAVVPLSARSNVPIIGKVDDKGFMARKNLVFEIEAIEKALVAEVEKASKQKRYADILGVDHPLVKQLAELTQRMGA